MRLLVIAAVSDRSEVALYKGLAEQGVSVEMFCDPRERKQEELQASGINLTELPVRHRLDFSAVRAIREKVLACGIDVIYTPFNRGLSTALFATRDLSVSIVTYRGTLGNLSNYSPASRLTHLHPRVSKIICNCEGVRSYLRSLDVSDDKLEVVYKGHSPSWYEGARAANRARFSVPENAFLVGCIANIRPLKGVDVLLQAAYELQSTTDIHYLLVGDNRDKRIVPLIKKLGLEERVHMCGFRPDVLPLIKACDLTVMPSTIREGFPRAVIEAMTMKKAAVVTDVGGMPEMVVDGVTGKIVKAGSVRALQAAIADYALRPNECEAAGKNAYRYVCRKFSFQPYLDRMLGILEATRPKPTAKLINQ